MDDFEKREIKAIVSETVKQSTPAAVKETLELFGVDVANPRETQADMHYLRKLRIGATDIGTYIKRSAIWAAICGFSYLIWETAKASLSQKI